MHGSTHDTRPDRVRAFGPGLDRRGRAISWPSTNGNAPPIPISVGDGPVLCAKRWRSLPQIPPVATSTRAQRGPGRSGSGSSTSEAGNSGSAMSNCTAAHAGSVRCSYVPRRARTPTPPSTRSRRAGLRGRRGFLSPDELAGRAGRRCGCTSRRPSAYFADPAAVRPSTRRASSRRARVPVPVVGLNRLAFHPDLVDAAERYLGRPSCTSTRWSCGRKYAGAVDYDQPLHRDYGSHSLVVPTRRDGRYQQLTTFIFLSDVTDVDGPTRDRPVRASARTCPSRRCTSRPASSARRRSRRSEPAGSLLVYRTDILHRGSNFTAPGRSRFSLLADFQARGTTWAGKMAWPKAGRPNGGRSSFPQCTVRERDLFGFPRPGTPTGTSRPLADVRRATRAST